MTDPKDQVTNYAYTVDGQIAATTYTYAVIATPGVSYTYEAAYPRAATMEDGMGVTTYTYKTAGQRLVPRLVARNSKLG